MSVIGNAIERVNRREKRISDSDHWYKRTFVVKTNNVQDDANIVETAFGLPKYGMHYITDKTVDLLSRCHQLSSRQVAPYLWEVDIEYTSNPAPGGGDGTELPVWEKPTWRWGGKQERTVVTGQSKWSESIDPSQETITDVYDTTGILNSAFEPYNPPAEIDTLLPTLVFSRNEPTFNHRYMLYYVNSINKHRWYGWHKRTVKISSITGEHKFKVIKGKTYPYWKVTYTLIFKKETWDLQLLDIGSYYFVGGYSTTSTAIKKPFMNKGVPFLGLLTSDGGAASDVSVPPISRYNRYRVLTELDFSRLMIPIIK